MRAESSFLRTAGKLEVDLILEPQDALLAFEIKNRATATDTVFAVPDWWLLGFEE